MTGPVPASWAPWLLSIVRIVAASVFITHGTQKLFAMPVAEPRDAVAVMSLLGLAALIELVGGGLLLLGLFTRTVAFIASGEMAFAYFIAHAPNSIWPVVNAGEPAVLYCFLFLYIAAAGAGPWSVDAMRRS